MSLKSINPDRIVAALDVGSTKTCAAVAVLEEEGARIVDYSVVPAKGIKKGLIIDLQGVSHSIGASIAMLEERVSARLSNVVLGLSSVYAKIIETSGIYRIKRGEITAADISRTLEASLSFDIGHSLERLHVIPQEFIIDGTEGIKNPLGMVGASLQARVAVVAADSKIMHSLIKICQESGLYVDCVVLQSLACAEAVFMDEDKDRGVILIDIGGGKTEVSVFFEGTLAKTALIPVGGNHFTNDLIIGLRLPYSEAERIKKQETLNLGISTEIEAFGMDGQIKNIALSTVESIINPRMEELFSLIRTHTEGFAVNEPLLGAVVTGGGARVGGLTSVAESILELPIRLGIPHIKEGYSLHGLAEDSMELMQPEYAVLIGLLLYGIDKSIAEGKVNKYSTAGRFLRGIKRLFRGKGK